MPLFIKQSTTQHKLMFFLTQSSDHITGLTGASPTVTISKAGAAFGSPSGAVSELANGWYQVAANATDTNTLGLILLHAVAASADPCDMMVADVIAPDPTDANWAMTNVSSNVVEISGSAVSTSTAQLGVNLVNIAGSAVSTSTAQLGVNVVNIAGQAATLDASNRLKIDVDGWNGTTVGALPTNFSSLSISAAGLVAVTSNVKTNTALNGFTFTMTDSTNHNPKTGLTVTGQRSLNGGAFGSCANSVSEISNGDYQINLAAGDLNAAVVMLRFTASGADDLNILLVTQP